MKTLKTIHALILEAKELKNKLKDVSDKEVVLLDHPHYSVRLSEIREELSAIKSIIVINESSIV